MGFGASVGVERRRSWGFVREMGKVDRDYRFVFTFAICEMGL